MKMKPNCNSKHNHWLSDVLLNEWKNEWQCVQQGELEQKHFGEMEMNILCLKPLLLHRDMMFFPVEADVMSLM